MFYYNNNKNPIAHKYLNHGTTVPIQKLSKLKLTGSHLKHKILSPCPNQLILLRVVNVKQGRIKRFYSSLPINPLDLVSEANNSSDKKKPPPPLPPQWGGGEGGGEAQEKNIMITFIR